MPKLYMETYILKNLNELTGFTQTFVSSLKERGTHATVIALHGDLGAGKTTFTQTLAKEFGVAEVVTSPTFIVMQAFSLPKTERFAQLVHIDAYRVEKDEEMIVLGLKDLLQDPKNLVVVEWADKIKELLPKETIHISLTIKDTDTREVEVIGL